VTDPRPRPQYGEYASPDEQARAMGFSDAASLSLSKQPVAPDAAAPETTTDSTTTDPAGTTPVASPYSPPGVGARSPGASAPGPLINGRPRRLWDAVLTIVLLGLGVISVTTSIPQYADFANTLSGVVSDAGYGDYTNTSLASNIGIAINVTQIVLFLATAAVSVMMVRRNRLAFYIPLIGAVLFFIVLAVLLVIALTGDPSVMSNVTNVS
jgi:hypothetical protein